MGVCYILGHAKDDYVYVCGVSCMCCVDVVDVCVHTHKSVCVRWV